MVITLEGLHDMTPRLEEMILEFQSIDNDMVIASTNTGGGKGRNVGTETNPIEGISYVWSFWVRTS